MKTVYLNSSNDVICASKIVRTVAEIVASVNPEVVTRILDAPDSIIVKGKHDLCFHRHVSGDGTDISHYSEVDFFDNYKLSRFKKITIRTNEILSEGFTHDSNDFTLLIDFRNHLGMLADLATEGVLTFPQRVICKNEFNTYEITNGLSLKNLYIAMAQAYKSIMGGDVNLKKQIADATTKTAIDAIVDSR